MDQLIFNTVIYVTLRDLEKTPIALPPKFKISDAEKFDGTGDLKQNVRRFLSTIEMRRLEEK